LENDIKKDIKELMCEGVDRNKPVQDRTNGMLQ
jgi:hypothetical protein